MVRSQCQGLPLGHSHDGCWRTVSTARSNSDTPHTASCPLSCRTPTRNTMQTKMMTMTAWTRNRPTGRWRRLEAWGGSARWPASRCWTILSKWRKTPRTLMTTERGTLISRKGTASRNRRLQVGFARISQEVTSNTFDAERSNLRLLNMGSVFYLATIRSCFLSPRLTYLHTHPADRPHVWRSKRRLVNNDISSHKMMTLYK